MIKKDKEVKPMRVLILTGKFGMGHYSVAEALKQEIEREEKEA